MRNFPPLPGPHASMIFVLMPLDTTRGVERGIFHRRWLNPRFVAALSADLPRLHRDRGGSNSAAEKRFLRLEFHSAPGVDNTVIVELPEVDAFAPAGTWVPLFTEHCRYRFPGNGSHTPHLLSGFQGPLLPRKETAEAQFTGRNPAPGPACGNELLAAVRDVVTAW